MKKLKCKFLFLIFIFALFIIKILPLFLPIKYAITEEQIDKSRNYIIIKMARDSGTCRYEIENNNGVVEPAKEIALVAYDPVYLFNYGIEYALSNKFVLYREKVDREFVYTIGGQQFHLDNVFEVKDWDILSPISRSDTLNLPKSYITFLDAGINPITLTKGYIWDFHKLKAEFNSNSSTSIFYGRKPLSK
jgi:hypothetical protein